MPETWTIESGLKPILNLQLMDMLGMDFLRPISPAGTGGAGIGKKSIYSNHCGLLFAEAVLVVDGATVVRTLQAIS